ncbi:hypothetical protein GOP47_0017430 [Adiantum capillus-veneris]|uniref:Alpha-1,3/1,6-mannosyltransferase ALG2 n=1 Tax=Adiantum capillus-veneris TaxID=13818 RepID=A0A9D4UFS5_ADICA|nr:hypothetical protein GOP47_0017430 [Adiantum capillus-veneris]
MSNTSSPSSEKKLKIAICHPDLGIGGAERLIVDAAVELASRGHYVHIFTAHYDKNRCFDETKEGNFSITVYGDFLPRHIFYRLHALCAYLRCLYVALWMIWLWPSFNIVLVDQVSAVIPLVKRTYSKVIFYCHFPDLLLAKHTNRLRKLYRAPIDWVEEETTGMADCVLVNSKFTASTFASTFKTLHAKGIRPEVLYPAVNIDQFQITSLVLQNNQEPFFLSINRFERKKNIGLSIKAFGLLLDSNNQKQGDSSQKQGGSSYRRLKLVIAGGYDIRLKENRDYMRELMDLTEEKGIKDHVVFMPSCSTEKRDELLATCLCLIYTPTDEHFGIVPLEAMAAQKPVIACNSGGPKESIVHSVTGFLCEPTPEYFSSAMNIILSDPQMSRQMGMSAREHVKKHFSRHVFGVNLNALAVRLLNQSG